MKWSLTGKMEQLLKLASHPIGLRELTALRILFIESVGMKTFPVLTQSCNWSILCLRTWEVKASVWIFTYKGENS